MLKKWSAAISRGLASKMFLRIALLWFILGAVVIALTSKYPMAFDENWHLGLIQVYAKYWLPFDIPKTPDMAALGAATSDPSYFFHYLMSFPYRVMNTWHWSQTSIIITLRMMDIAMFTGALILFWKTLRGLGLSLAKANVVIAGITLIPIAPLLAAEINYDNLMLLFVAGLFWLTVQITTSLRTSKRLNPVQAYLLLAVIFFGCATKYAFMPLALISGVWIVFLMIRHHMRWRHFWQQIRRLPKTKHILLVLLVIIGGTLLSRDVYNLATYHKLAPPCDYFFSVNECEAYGPWDRDYHLKEEKPIRHPNFVAKSYPAYIISDWIPGITTRLFFTVSGPEDDYDSAEPLPIPVSIYVTFCLLGFAGLVWSFWLLARRNPIVWYILATILLYCLSLSLDVYKSYRATAEPVAINGRYLLPLAPLIGFVLLTGLDELVTKLRFKKYLPSVCAVALLIIVAQGGGAVTYFALAKNSWFLPGIAQSTGEWLRAVLSHTILLHWPWQK